MISLMRSRHAIVLSFACVLTSCASIELVSQYDQTTDASATQLQKDIKAFFVKVETTEKASERSFAGNRAFYETALIDTKALEIRAAGIAHNTSTIDQIDLVEQNLALLALMHKGCLTGPPKAEQIEKIKAQGPDLSLDCRIDYGASTDRKGRGGSVLNVYATTQLQQTFDQTLGAVIALELAKKRGEK